MITSPLNFTYRMRSTMKTFKSVVCSALLAINFIYSGSAMSATGSIILRDKDNAICNIPVPEPGTTKQYSIDWEPCGRFNDRARTIQLAEVPSATTIIIANRGNCQADDTNEYMPWFKMKTTKKLTSTMPIEIEYLATFQKGQIIEPGLQMKDFRTNGSNRDNISCVRISTSYMPAP